MKKRIAFWGLTGFTVASFWVIFAMTAPPNPGLGHSLIVTITAPASLLGRTMPLAYYWFILLNAAAYAFVGMAAELARWSMVRHRLS